jgi:hypothetical protein
VAASGGGMRVLRVVALMATVAGGVGSVAFTVLAGRRTPRLLLVVFVIWVLSPFVALAWANLRSARWSAATRAALQCVTLVVVLASLAIYGDVIVVAPPGSPNAFKFVVVAPASWLLMAIVVAIAALVSRRLSLRRSRP